MGIDTLAYYLIKRFRDCIYSLYPTIIFSSRLIKPKTYSFIIYIYHYQYYF